MSADNSEREAILEQAASWCAAHRAGKLSMADRAAFLAWLKRSPAHIEEYFGVVAAARVLAAEAHSATESAGELDVSNPGLANDNIIPFGSDELAPPAEPGPAHIRGKLLLRVAIACAAFFTLGVFAYAFRETLKFGFGDTYQTVHGQQGSWRLPEGSVLYLNTRSAATVRFTDEERLVEVHYGQAMFRVAHEVARRFRVVSGTAEIIAVGTEFDVYKLNESTRVTTINGRVAVLQGLVPSHTTPALQVDGAVALNAGQQLVVSPTSISKPSAVSIEQASAWLQRRIVFERDSLQRVVAEFNRYSSVPLQIADQSLRGLQITGSFNAYDLDSFLEFMRRVDGVTVETRPDVILLLKRAPHAVRPLATEAPSAGIGEP